MNNTNNTTLRSSIFLSDLTVCDHAYINNKGQVIGGSFNPGFIVTGEIDPTEKVVVDFSTIKKDIKHFIDRHLHDVEKNGFDHKLWFIEGYSEGSLIHNINGTYTINSFPSMITLPTDAIKYIPQVPGYESEYSVNYIGKAFEIYLTELLSEKYPLVNITVECFNNVNVHLIDKSLPYNYFTYSHGLKDSTSYGCQNIAHGHLSFIQHNSPKIGLEIAALLDEAVFINKENIINETEHHIQIEYTTVRGTFNAVYDKALNKIIVLDTETTIELIAE